ncbi:unnamed protein product [Amoebophrya sp. A120]|nr:unnamed protein product [Amoebophrya sp. A120]|eukprot:GSA120T00008779001.1
MASMTNASAFRLTFVLAQSVFFSGVGEAARGGRKGRGGGEKKVNLNAQKAVLTKEEIQNLKEVLQKKVRCYHDAALVQIECHNGSESWDGALRKMMNTVPAAREIPFSEEPAGTRSKTTGNERYSLKQQKDVLGLLAGKIRSNLHDEHNVVQRLIEQLDRGGPITAETDLRMETLFWPAFGFPKGQSIIQAFFAGSRCLRARQNFWNRKCTETLYGHLRAASEEAKKQYRGHSEAEKVFCGSEDVGVTEAGEEPLMPMIEKTLSRVKQARDLFREQIRPYVKQKQQAAQRQASIAGSGSSGGHNQQSSRFDLLTAGAGEDNGQSESDVGSPASSYSTGGSMSDSANQRQGRRASSGRGVLARRKKTQAAKRGGAQVWAQAALLAREAGETDELLEKLFEKERKRNQAERLEQLGDDIVNPVGSASAFGMLLATPMDMARAAAMRRAELQMKRHKGSSAPGHQQAAAQPPSSQRFEELRPYLVALCQFEPESLRADDGKMTERSSSALSRTGAPAAPDELESIATKCGSPQASRYVFTYLTPLLQLGVSGRSGERAATVLRNFIASTETASAKQLEEMLQHKASPESQLHDWRVHQMALLAGVDAAEDLVKFSIEHLRSYDLNRVMSLIRDRWEKEWKKDQAQYEETLFEAYSQRAARGEPLGKDGDEKDLADVGEPDSDAELAGLESTDVHPAELILIWRRNSVARAARRELYDVFAKERMLMAEAAEEDAKCQQPCRAGLLGALPCCKSRAGPEVQRSLAKLAKLRQELQLVTEERLLKEEKAEEVERISVFVNGKLKAVAARNVLGLQLLRGLKNDMNAIRVGGQKRGRSWQADIQNLLEEQCRRIEKHLDVLDARTKPGKAPNVRQRAQKSLLVWLQGRLETFFKYNQSKQLMLSTDRDWVMLGEQLALDFLYGSEDLPPGTEPLVVQKWITN